MKWIVKWVQKVYSSDKLLLDYTKRNHRKIFHSSTKPTASDLDIDEAFDESMNQSIMKKTKTMLMKIALSLM